MSSKLSFTCALWLNLLNQSTPKSSANAVSNLGIPMPTAPYHLHVLNAEVIMIIEAAQKQQMLNQNVPTVMESTQPIIVDALNSKNKQNLSLDVLVSPQRRHQCHLKLLDSIEELWQRSQPRNHSHCLYQHQSAAGSKSS